jgi:error-prone DNA polymerase
MSAYAELAVTTNFSFLRGASHPQEMVETADELGQIAIGIADRNSFAGVVRAYDEAKNRNIKLVVGTRLVTIRPTAPLTAGSAACSPPEISPPKKANVI